MTYVIVKAQFEAIHNWPGVVDHEDLMDVSFLKDPHRHIFHIKATKEVHHDDRDVEIIMLKRAITSHLETEYPDKQFGAKSCEMLARELSEYFNLSSCEVTEDDENGAVYVRD